MLPLETQPHAASEIRASLVGQLRTKLVERIHGTAGNSTCLTNNLDDEQVERCADEHVAARHRLAVRDWSECLEYARAVSEAIVRGHPALYTTTFAKVGRERKILIDYLRNNRTNTSICAYSPRARQGAPVSMPVDWKDLTTAPDRWTVQTVPKRLRGRRDPWADYWKSSQRLSTASIKALRGL